MTMHSFYRIKKIAAVLLVGLLTASQLPAVALPSSLKAEPHQRDSYNWQERHQAILKRHETVKPEYVIIGDSITHFWGGEPVNVFHAEGDSSWKRLFGNHPVTNMGFGFDYVDNAYYRIQHGELDGISPRVIILMIGTNNLGHRKDSAKDCAVNTKALIELIRKKCPGSKVLLLGILPRKEPALAPVIQETNKFLSKLHNGKTVFFANPGQVLLDTQGQHPQNNYMRDTVHPNTKGYNRLGDEVAGLLKQMDPKFQGGQVQPKPELIQNERPEQVQLVMIGDSITHNYSINVPPNQAFEPIWKKYFTPLHALNYGISGNTTEDVMDRIDSGILDHVRPKVAVIMIGTNDTGTGRSVEETLLGIKRVTAKVQSKLPATRILLLGILPNDIRDWHVEGAKDPAGKWKKDQQINAELAAFYKRNQNITFLNLEKKFLTRDGQINEDLFYDPKEVNFLGRKCGPLHPDTQGQRIMAEAVISTITPWMKQATPMKK